MCLIGASLGGAIALTFALKYPSYVSTMCFLAPPGKFNLCISHRQLGIILTIVLTSLFIYDYLNLEDYYQQLINLNISTLVLWGRDDKV